jgi:hypothetical protein
MHTDTRATPPRCRLRGDRTARAQSGRRDYMVALSSARRVENAIRGFGFSSSTTQPATTSNELAVRWATASLRLESWIPTMRR